MSWSFEVPGPLKSWNHSYHPVVIPFKDSSGQKRTRISIAKKEGIEAWQTTVAYIVRAARPSGWVPGPQIKLTYDFYMGRSMDVDNSYKIIQDAIAAALGVDDRIFLPCARTKVTGDPSPRTIVTVE